jgi:DMSO reductase family type II enzyme chaperone
MVTAVATTGSVTPRVNASRALIYETLSQSFEFPDEALHSQARDGGFAAELSDLLEELPYRVRSSDLSWRVPEAYDEMQSEYIRLFQIGGRRGPPCPLHAGHYVRDRGRELQHLIRFYNFFGFRAAECVMPDHLGVQLEFAGALCREPRGAGGTLRAQGDFLNRHLGWLPELAIRVRRRDPVPFYRSLAAFAARYVAADQQFVRQALGRNHGTD